MQVDVWSYSALVKGFVQSGDILEARALLQDMTAQGIKPNEVCQSVASTPSMHCGVAM